MSAVHITDNTAAFIKGANAKYFFVARPLQFFGDHWGKVSSGQHSAW